MKANVEFPPVRVWFDGKYYWLSDGFQRLEAANRIGKLQVAAEVLLGTLEDAKWDSFSVNGSHGVRRSAADLQEIIRRCIAHPKAAQLSNNQLARHLNVPEATFRRWRRRVSSSPGEDKVRIAVRGNATYPIKTVNIGKGHRRNDRCAKSCSVLEQELEEMKCSASPDTRRFLNIFGNWLRTKAKVSTTLDAIEGLVSELTERTVGLRETVSGGNNGGQSLRGVEQPNTDRRF
jgi:hypothetical protein